MTPKTITIIALRMLGIYWLFASLTSLEVVFFQLSLREPDSTPFAGFQILQSILFVAGAFVLFIFAEPVARRITGKLPESTSVGGWTPVELLAILLAVSSAYVILSSIPTFINQLNAFAGFYNSDLMQSYAEKERFNRLVVGLLGSCTQIGVAGILFLKAKHVAMFWEKVQPAGAANQQPNPTVNANTC